MSKAGDGAAREPLLRIVDLHKKFGDLEVLSGCQLDVARGEKVSIIGPSGSGKTTLLRCINYLEKPSAGHIYIDGTLIGEKKIGGRFVHLSDRELAKERQEIGFVFQRFNLFPHLTALGNVTIAPIKVLGLSREDAEARGREMLEKVGLGHKIDEYPERLSGGQQQRVAIARVLAMQPKLMLFDEATSALDPELIGEVLRVMRQLAEEGATMVIVTHEIQFAGEVSDRVDLHGPGKIVEQGPPKEVLFKPQRAAHPRISQAHSGALSAGHELLPGPRAEGLVLLHHPPRRLAGDAHRRLGRAGLCAGFRARHRADAHLALALLRWPATAYIEFFRGTPALVQLFVIYFGFPDWGFQPSPLQAAIIGLGMNGAAYIAEIYRAGIESIHRGQMEAALSLGMTPVSAMQYIILPQAIRTMLPPMTNFAIVLLKDTAIVFAVGVLEIMALARQPRHRNAHQSAPST